MKRKMKKLSSLLLTLCLTLSLCLGSAYAANRMFSDSAGHWAEDIIQELAERGIIAGYPDGTVKPDNSQKRHFIIHQSLVRTIYNAFIWR